MNIIKVHKHARRCHACMHWLSINYFTLQPCMHASIHIYVYVKFSFIPFANESFSASADIESSLTTFGSLTGSLIVWFSIR